MASSLLTSSHHQLLESFAKEAYLTSSFYLTGGTALSEYYLHHRYSEDLDFFCEKPYDLTHLTSAIKHVADQLEITNIEIQSLHGQHTYWFSLQDQKIKVDFAHFPFEHLGMFYKVGSMNVSSLLDITINKVQAIISRKRGRDFLDLYLAVKKQEITYKDLIKQYQLKFDMHIKPEELAKHFLGILDAVDQPRFLGDTKWSQVEDFFKLQADLIQKTVSL